MSAPVFTKLHAEQVHLNQKKKQFPLMHNGDVYYKKVIKRSL